MKARLAQMEAEANKLREQQVLPVLLPLAGDPGLFHWWSDIAHFAAPKLVSTSAFLASALPQCLLQRA